MAAPSTGSVVAGRYRLGEMIGEGGMARVWRATDTTLAREVAVKFLFLREGRDQRTMVARFLREARLAAAVRHPNVVDLIDFGTTEEGRPFMVMELLAGESLEDRLSRSPSLTVEELVRIAAATLDGLAAVHKAGIVHRDLKPDNVFLLHDDGEVRPKLLDFGVSRDTDPTSGRRSALTTSDGYLVGTPEYMSPEQARGLSDIDRTSDIYAMGVILYEALTGRLPYEAEAVGDLIIDIVQGGAPRVSELRPEVGAPLSVVIERAMATARQARFQSAREMRDALLAAAEESLGLDVRASLPTMRLERLAAAGVAARAPRSDVHTMDDEQVPIPLDRISETPRSWERSAPPEPRASRWPWLVAALLVPAAGGAAFWLVTQSHGAPAATEVASTTVAPPEEPEVEPEVASADERAQVVALDPPGEPEVAPESSGVADGSQESVTVTLRGLPRQARVNVDGEWVEVDGEALSLPRDGSEHRVTVVAPGRRPWRVSHLAESDASYRVRLRRGSPDAEPDEAPPPEPSPASGTTEAPEPAPAASSEPAAAPSAEPPPPAEEHRGVFRDLDY